jgi:hypothetical protein
MKSWSKGCLIMVCIFMGAIASVQAQKSVILFTPQEAGELRMSDKDLQSLTRTRSISLGPQILIKSPPLKNTENGPMIESGSPLTFSVLFKDSQSPVDMTSLDIKAKKGIFSKSLTDRLKPYIRGTALEAKSVEIPEGKFRIEISIADKSGMKTVESYVLVVK